MGHLLGVNEPSRCMVYCWEWMRHRDVWSIAGSGWDTEMYGLLLGVDHGWDTEMYGLLLGVDETPRCMVYCWEWMGHLDVWSTDGSG